MSATTGGLTKVEHDRAKIIAYYKALARGGNRVPDYDLASAESDFREAADFVIAQRGTTKPHEDLFEQDEDFMRLIPTALRNHKRFRRDDKAVFEFEKMAHELSDQDYWSLLGHIWVNAPKTKGQFDKRYSEVYRRLLLSDRPEREKMMTPAEREKLKSLKSPLTVHRGCQANLNEKGLSWSLTVKTGVNFAYTYYVTDRTWLTGTCDVANVYAYFDYDDEDEIIVKGEDVTVSKKTKVELPLGQYY